MAGFAGSAVSAAGVTLRRVRLHGRDREQAAIGALLPDAQAGAGGALVLFGDPGVGKSILLADTVRGTATMTVHHEGVAVEIGIWFMSSSSAGSGPGPR